MSSIDLTFFAAPDGWTDNTPDLIAALLIFEKVIIPSHEHPWVFNGTIPLPSNKRVQFKGAPTIRMTVDGDNRGFYFQPGCNNTKIKGDAVINHTRNVYVSPLGDYGGCFTFSHFLYGKDNPEPVSGCSVSGDITVRGMGEQNTKTVNIYGYTDGVKIRGVKSCGRQNYAYVAHWTGNHADASICPTKTWHPTNLVFKECAVFQDPLITGKVIRSFTFSACGKVSLVDCESLEPTSVSWNLFCGDYGPTFSENVKQNDMYQYTLTRCRSRGDHNHMTVDMQTVGLYGSPVWTNGRSKVIVNDMTMTIPVSATEAVAVSVSHVGKFHASNLRVLEEGSINTKHCLDFFGVEDLQIEGELAASKGVRARNCGRVLDDMSKLCTSPGVGESYGLLVSATSGTATTVGNMVVGRESIIVSGCDIVSGAGGFIQFSVGGVSYQTAITGSSHVSPSHPGNQVIPTGPVPVYIPTGTTVTIIQTVKSVQVGPVVIDGFTSAVKAIGTDAAKPRNISLCGTVARNSGNIDFDIDAADGFTEIGTVHSDGGRLAGDNDYGTRLGPRAENFAIVAANFDSSCTRLRYLVLVDNAAKHGVISSCRFMAFNSGATSPAAVFLKDAANVKISQDNVYGSGVVKKYPA